MKAATPNSKPIQEQLVCFFLCVFFFFLAHISFISLSAVIANSIPSEMLASFPQNADGWQRRMLPTHRRLSMETQRLLIISTRTDTGCEDWARKLQSPSKAELYATFACCMYGTLICHCNLFSCLSSDIFIKWDVRNYIHSPHFLHNQVQLKLIWGFSHIPAH